MPSDDAGWGELRFEERWRSGRVGWVHARNCLHVQVTGLCLVVRGHFPFSLVTRIAGVDIVVPRESARPLPEESELDVSFRHLAPRPPIRLVVDVGGGAARTVALWLRDPERFLEALFAHRAPPSQGEYR